MSDDEIVIPRVLLQAVFDCAVNSMDFSSGFLDEEDVEHLRTIAAILGVDPMNATPENRQCKYDGKHVLNDVPARHLPAFFCWKCRVVPNELRGVMSKEIHNRLVAEGCVFFYAKTDLMGGKFTLITATCENEEDAASVRRWAEKNDCKHDVHVATSEEAASWKRQAAQLAMRTP